MAGPLTVQGTNGNDAIAYRAPTIVTNQGLVSINNLETIEFGSKTSLTINTLNGTDAVSLNNTTAQTGLTSITVNGGDSSSGDTLTVTGTTGTDTVAYTPTGVGSGNVVFSVPALPPIAFANIAGVTYDGQGGGDTLTVNSGVVSNARFTLSPGSNVDSGTVQVNTTAALSYKNLGTAALAGGGVKGIGRFWGWVTPTLPTPSITWVTITAIPTRWQRRAGRHLGGQPRPVHAGGPDGDHEPDPGGRGREQQLQHHRPGSLHHDGDPGRHAGGVVGRGRERHRQRRVAGHRGPGRFVGHRQRRRPGALTFTGTRTVNVNNGTGNVLVTGTASPDDLVVTPTRATTRPRSRITASARWST